METELNERISELQSEVASTQAKLQESRSLLKEGSARETKISRSVLEVCVCMYIYRGTCMRETKIDILVLEEGLCVCTHIYD